MNLEEKRSRLEAEHNRRKKRKKIVLGTFLILVVLGVVGVILSTQESLPGLDDKYHIGKTMNYKNAQVKMTTVNPEISNGEVKLPLATLEQSGIIWANYDPNFDIGNGQKGLPVMAYVTPAGRVMVTVSFCEPCYSRTFHIDNEQLVCDTCGTRWALADLTGLGGGCVKYPPAEIKYTVQNGQIIIQEADLKNWHPRDYDSTTTTM